MFDKFGEFDSAEEINESADGLLNEGDFDNIKVLAKENGIDECYVDMLIAGDIPDLCDIATAAIGKLDVEAEELEINGVLEDWKNVIEELCLENESMQQAVRKKDKHLVECMALLLGFAFNNKVQISSEIVNITKVEHNGKEEKMRGPVYLGVPNKRQVKELATTYYLGEQSC